MDNRRYGNRPGLYMGLFLLGFAIVLFFFYPTGWENRTILICGGLSLVIIILHWRYYLAEARSINERMIRCGICGARHGIREMCEE